MDVQAAVTERIDVDPRSLLEFELERTRADREEIAHAYLRDQERMTAVRAGLDAMATHIWHDVNAQQQSARARDNMIKALTLSWLSASRSWVALLLVAFSIVEYFVLGWISVLIAVALYVGFAFLGYLIVRGAGIEAIKKLRKHLGKDGKDVRFVTFVNVNHAVMHPYIGYDGPLDDNSFEERSWKIPGVSDKDALSEVFFEVMDARPCAVVLSRFPDKTPTLVHAEIDNEFIKVYGVFLQRAIERQLPSMRKLAYDFRNAVARYAKLKSLDERMALLEQELEEFDRTIGALQNVGIPDHAKKIIARNVSLFRMGDPDASSGLLLCGPSEVDKSFIVKTVAEAAGANFVPLAVSEVRTAYVGQGAAYVLRGFAEARIARSIIFIDDCEKIFGKRGEVQFGPMRNEIHQAILNEWESVRGGGKVWVVGATDYPELIDQNAVLRFGTIVDLSRALPSLAHKAIEEAGLSQPSASEATSWERFQLSSAVLDRLRELALVVRHGASMQEQGIESGALLIHGPMGNGKPEIVRTFAREAGLGLVGAAPNDAPVAFERAREHAPVVLLLDSIDAVAPELRAELLEHLEHAPQQRIFVVGVTSDLEAVDPEIRARFEDVIEIANPDQAQRARMLQAMLENKPFATEIADRLDEIAERCEGRSRSQLVAMVRQAIRKAAVRAIEAGNSDRVTIVPEDLGLTLPPHAPRKPVVLIPEPSEIGAEPEPEFEPAPEIVAEEPWEAEFEVEVEPQARRVRAPVVDFSIEDDEAGKAIGA